MAFTFKEVTCPYCGKDFVPEEFTRWQTLSLDKTVSEAHEEILYRLDEPSEWTTECPRCWGGDHLTPKQIQCKLEVEDDWGTLT